MADQTEDEIKKAEQYEALKQMVMRLLDDPQIQHKLVAVIRRHLGKGIQNPTTTFGTQPSI